MLRKLAVALFGAAIVLGFLANAPLAQAQVTCGTYVLFGIQYSVCGSPTPTPGPTYTPSYVNDTPGANGSYPIILATVPPALASAGSLTIVMGANCQQNASGNQGASFASAWSFNLGTFDSGTNPSGSNGWHLYASSPYATQVSAVSSLIAGTPPGPVGQQYVLGGTINQATGILTTYSGTAGSGGPYVVTSTAAPTATALASPTAACIGGAGNSCASRVASCDLWHIHVWPTALPSAQLTTELANVPVDPYPTPSSPVTPTPTPTASNLVYTGPNAPTLGENFFGYETTTGACVATGPCSPFFATLPPSPNPIPSSSAYIAAFPTATPLNFGYEHIFYNPPTTPFEEIAHPVFFNHQGANIPVTVQTYTQYTTGVNANINGRTYYLDPGMQPQGLGCPYETTLAAAQANNNCPSDSHMVIVDPTTSCFNGVIGTVGCVTVIYHTHWPPYCTSGPFQAGATGCTLFASYGGEADAFGANGFTNANYEASSNYHSYNDGCGGGDASGTCLNVGAVDPNDWYNAAISYKGGNTSASLRQAVSVVLYCPGTNPQPSPFIGGGDGKCAGQMPEGSHIVINLTDAQIATCNAAPLVSVLLTTLDKQHRGGFIVDSSGTNLNNPANQDGLEINTIGFKTYGWNNSSNNPTLTLVKPEAVSEGLPVTTNTGAGTYDVQLVIPQTSYCTQLVPYLIVTSTSGS